MSGWAGFSEDEMRKLQQKDSVVASKRKVRPSCGNRQQLQTESILKRAVQANAGFEYIELPPEQRLNKPPMKGECCEAIAPGGPAVQCDAQQSAREEKTQEKCEEADEKRNPEVKEPGKQEMELRDKTRLEQLHRDQKIIEERNKRKKALLAKTIAEKSKQTQAEAVKLKRIQKELQALDDMVSNDIDILRGKIEQASWDYTTARKRYDKAEAEYVLAKFDLHKKTDVKEQLTEHLYAIIQQNELRKALKLEDMMQQLQLQATEEELEKQKMEEEYVGRSTDLQGHMKEQNGVFMSPDGTVQWTPEESQKKDVGIQLEHQLSNEVQCEEDCKAEEKKCYQHKTVAQT
ncbi:RAB6-interacting golgin isoform X2 [Festucalex cinctus]